MSPKSDLFSPEEMSILPLVNKWNSTEADYPRELCVQQLFEQTAASHPEKMAVVEAWGGESRRVLTYSEMNQKANQLAHYLRTRGVGPGTLVGVYLEQSIELVYSIMAILKAGGAYVPMDPDYPADRIEFMINDF